MRSLILALTLLIVPLCSARSQGPIAWFSFDHVGDIGRDENGVANAIEVTRVTQIPGVTGLAARFESGWLQLPEDPRFNLLQGDFSLSLFVRSTCNSAATCPGGQVNRNWFTKASVINHRYGLGGAGSALSGWGLLFNGNGAFGVVASHVPLFDGEWHHVAAIKRGLTAELWLDGQLIEAATNINPSFGDDGAFAIGRDGQCCEFFNGDMDEVKIWGYALSPAEVAIEARPVAPPTLDDLVKDLVVDVISLNIHHGITTALNAKLDAALAALGRDDSLAAIGALKAFVNQARAQSGKQISGTEAEKLIAEAEAIITLLLEEP